MVLNRLCLGFYMVLYVQCIEGKSKGNIYKIYVFVCTI